MIDRLTSGVRIIFSSYQKTATVMFILGIALAIPFTLSLLAQQQDVRQRASGPEQRVCFCHNAKNNPVVICTSDAGLINGHMKHVEDGNDTLSDTCPAAGGIAESGQPSISPSITQSQVSIAPSQVSETPAPSGQCSLHPKGDANCDNKVNLDDFNWWRAEFHTYRNHNAPQTSPDADFNNDLTVNTDDFNIWRDGFLNPSIGH